MNNERVIKLFQNLVLRWWSTLFFWNHLQCCVWCNSFWIQFRNRTNKINFTGRANPCRKQLIKENTARFFFLFVIKKCSFCWWQTEKRKKTDFNNKERIYQFSLMKISLIERKLIAIRIKLAHQSVVLQQILMRQSQEIRVLQFTKNVNCPIWRTTDNHVWTKYFRCGSCRWKSMPFREPKRLLARSALFK